MIRKILAKKINIEDTSDLTSFAKEKIKSLKP